MSLEQCSRKAAFWLEHNSYWCRLLRHLYPSFLPETFTLLLVPLYVPLWKVFLGVRIWLPIRQKPYVPYFFLNLISAGDKPLCFIWEGDSHHCWSHIWIPPRSCLQRRPEESICKAFLWHLLVFIKHLENFLIFTTELKKEELTMIKRYIQNTCLVI